MLYYIYYIHMYKVYVIFSSLKENVKIHKVKNCLVKVLQSVSLSNPLFS